ncbi:MAG: activator of HSP90 ATPase 1 family protein [uncultured bacterium]|nr:MAG: activator of HSP90 ATPase 1 family protein [uncultured bacterium]KKR17722.1 MAG: Activator of Hsp90 ATPase 1 family protein [Candidatus Levybacteria bacterium GW2011_GWA1_39_32]KKR51505.1 MAG: Activator of Hsp90 ATPase 1 family protein [Candidatus Levybacteria bacterium GW2011_GWC1_40_19]KKR95430.1 MAG: Activator of Hsp90 ATPase 1 family protein [Candidatus Levybacteria bacterium GW2011_GWA2_41_15]KKS01915.1 MAG: Activator of Hsp90 ATPase 1 family protein [Candidatus Levybacteria bacter
MRTITKNYTINAPIEKVWDALVNPVTIDKWGGGPVKMEATQNFKFEIWGGDIHGKNIKVEKNKILKQDWYSGDWSKPSRLRFELFEKDGKTILHLLHENVPDDEAKDIDKGWDDYYLGPIKDLLEK